MLDLGLFSRIKSSIGAISILSPSGAGMVASGLDERTGGGGERRVSPARRCAGTVSVRPPGGRHGEGGVRRGWPGWCDSTCLRGELRILNTPDEALQGLL